MLYSAQIELIILMISLYTAKILTKCWLGQYYPILTCFFILFFTGFNINCAFNLNGRRGLGEIQLYNYHKCILVAAVNADCWLPLAIAILYFPSMKTISVSQLIPFSPLTRFYYAFWKCDLWFKNINSNASPLFPLGFCLWMLQFFNCVNLSQSLILLFYKISRICYVFIF